MVKARKENMTSFASGVRIVVRLLWIQLLIILSFLSSQSLAHSQEASNLRFTNRKNQRETEEGAVRTSGIDHLVPPLRIQGKSREFSFTNKESGWFYGETNAPAQSGWHGWFINAQKILRDYEAAVDGIPLRRDSTVLSEVFPDKLVRRYANGIIETSLLPDHIDALLVQLDFSDDQEHQVEIWPLFDSPIPDDSSHIRFFNGMLLINRIPSDQLNLGSPEWVGIGASRLDGEILNSATSPINTSLVRPLSFSPAALSLKAQRHVRIIFSAADAPEACVRRVSQVAIIFDSLSTAKYERLRALIARTDVKTADKRFTLALRWAKASLDALIMKKRGTGIFAGLPWFDNYWGRDSFISLRGAALVTGDWGTARDVLRSYAQFQERDTSLSTYGRIPNQITPSSVSYNTADATPWFVISLWEYIRRSGDIALACEMYPTVLRAIEGTIKYHTDSLHFLTHGDAETWMDAVGPGGPWSPRGNRAVDVQWLWYEQLRASAEIAQLIGDEKNSTAWKALAEKVQRAFNDKFVDRGQGLLYDHLRSDGTPSSELRPNQIFALPIIHDDELAASITKTVVQKLTYPYGVASLWQGDVNFHPYHHAEQYYVPDAAYHNGTVWVWLAGSVIDALSRFDREDLAYELMKSMIHDILDRGAVGTLSELLDALPHPDEKEPNLSGTFSQAWSLAEFIRVVYDDFFGVHPDALQHRIDFYPRIPEDLGDVEFSAFISNGSVVFTKHAQRWTLRSQLRDSYRVHFSLPVHNHNRSEEITCFDAVAELPPRGTLTLELTDKGVKVNGTLIRSLQKKSIKRRLYEIHFAVPTTARDFPVLRSPDYPLLTLKDVKQENPRARLLWDAIDPAYDDTGASGYTYPLNPAFRPGILDVTHCTIAADSENLYVWLRFRNLVNPGWHPEYGFQLTYVALAIDQCDTAGSRHVGMNAQYEFSPPFKFQRIVYVGGGIRVVDDKGKILAEYRPSSSDARNPIGNSTQHTISFSLPLRYFEDCLSSLGRWKFALLVGAQDDHGGAGIGEFRAVEEKPGEWVGGGKKIPSLPNVYDVINE
ncbi:MAG: amylo-alpha-1,6-glucosidase [Bacteroidota bacterium]